MVERLAIQSAAAASDLVGTELVPARQWTGAQWISVYLTVQQIADFAAAGGTITIADVEGLQDALDDLAEGSGITDTTLAALADIADAVNTTGKTRHKLMAATDNERVYRALGPDDNDAWRALDDPAGIEEITPA